MYSITKKDAKKLAKQIEVLAKRVQTDLDGKGDYLNAANELVRNSMTMVFALGELHAARQLVLIKPATTKKVARKAVNKTRASRMYYRDTRGRFASKP